MRQKERQTDTVFIAARYAKWIIIIIMIIMMMMGHTVQKVQQVDEYELLE